MRSTRRSPSSQRATSAARGPNSAAPASEPTALTEIEPAVVHLDRERLAEADEDDERDEREDVVAGAEA